MMDKKTSIDFSLSPTACFAGAMMLLILPLRWILAAVTAAAFHELCHYTSLRLCGLKVRRLTLGAAGTVMETEPMPAGKQLVCALAGPTGSFLLLFLAKWMPAVALCGLVQGCYNLLPLYPSDGGRVLRSGLELLRCRHSEKAAGAVEWGVIAVIAGLAAYGWIVLRLGFLPVLGSLMLIQRAILRKIPCKDGPHWVQ